MKTSVALCTYNGEAYILKQLESILNQTQQVDEIVVCDDGSSDDTVRLVESFAGASPVPVRIYKNEVNLGVLKNFERALCRCSGDILFLSDQDDVWMQDKVETVCRYFMEHRDKDVIFTNAELVDEAGDSLYGKMLFDAVGMNRRSKRMFLRGQEYEVLLVASRVTGATMAVRQSFLPSVLPFPETTKAMHDEIIAVTAALGHKIGFIEQCLIRYRLHVNQTLGLGGLLYHGSQQWDRSGYLAAWHVRLIDRQWTSELAQMRFVHERFRAIRSKFSLFSLAAFYCGGRYHRYCDRPVRVFAWDVLTVGRRFFTPVRTFFIRFAS